MKEIEIILDLAKLDNILLRLCKLIQIGQNKNPKLYGLVGAAIIDKENNIVLKTSKFQNNKWSHAEREAIYSYENKFGDIKEDCILICTLSPCNEIYTYPALDRHGESCTKLINKKGIDIVYCGYEDPSQGNYFYNKNKFKLIKSKDLQIIQLCKKYTDKFLMNDIL